MKTPRASPRFCTFHLSPMLPSSLFVLELYFLASTQTHTLAQCPSFCFPESNSCHPSSNKACNRIADDSLTLCQGCNYTWYNKLDSHAIRFSSFLTTSDYLIDLISVFGWKLHKRFGDSRGSLSDNSGSLPANCSPHRTTTSDCQSCSGFLRGPARAPALPSQQHRHFPRRNCSSPSASSSILPNSILGCCRISISHSCHRARTGRSSLRLQSDSFSEPPPVFWQVSPSPTDPILLIFREESTRLFRVSSCCRTDPCKFRRSIWAQFRSWFLRRATCPHSSCHLIAWVYRTRSVHYWWINLRTCLHFNIFLFLQLPNNSSIAPLF